MIFRFLHPYLLLLLVAVPGMVYWHLKIEKKKKGALRYPLFSTISNIEGSYRILFRNTVSFLRITAAALLVLALARPQSGVKSEEVSTQGIDIMLLQDVSTSMRSEDFRPENRLGVSKKVVEKFINGRKSDRIGLVAFAANAFTLCPLTLDYDLVVNALKSLSFAAPEEDGTAIGNAIATAVNRLRDSKAKSRILILSTDGANSRGEIDPMTAAKAAAALKIKVYTIGVGKEGLIPYPIDDPIFGRTYQQIPSDLDEGALQNIANETGGRFFRAKDPKALDDIYQQIDKMEKTEIRSQVYTTYSELFQVFVVLAALLLMAEIILSNTAFRRIP
jgi:Ca-activated chloride channel family protein